MKELVDAYLKTINKTGMQTLTQQHEIKVLREFTKEITSSKEAARAYLKKSGILAYLKKASKAPSTSGVNGKH